MELFINSRIRFSALAGVLMLTAEASFSATVPVITSTATVRVVRVRYQPVGACLGVDDTIPTDPVAIMAPIGGANTARATITPASQASRVRFDSANTGVATVNPAAATASPQDIQVSGVSRAEVLIRARTATSGVLRSLRASAKPRLDYTLAIHAITEQNDDVQLNPPGSGAANPVCITPGPNGALNSTRIDDDVLVGTTTIHAGPNGICSSVAAGDDVQVIPPGRGRPCVGGGANAFRDSVRTGDDLIVGNDIDSGANGICDTTANSTNLVPADVPTAADMQTELERTWGQQANVFITVTRTDAVMNYDLDRNGMLADPFLVSATDDEVNVLSGAATAGVSFNVYFVRSYEVPAALAIRARGEAWVGDTHTGTAAYVAAHEVGHLLGRAGDLGAALGDLMFANTQATSPCEVRRIDWNLVNP